MNVFDFRGRPRVVITGMGVIAPGAADLSEFERLLRRGDSAVKYWPEAASLGMACQVAGIPFARPELLDAQMPPSRRRALSPLMEYAALAAIECWRDAQLPYDCELSTNTDWDSGVSVGTGVGPIDVIAETVAPAVAQKAHRRMGSRIVERSMVSGAAAAVCGLFGLGGPAVTMSSACSSGAAAIAHALRLIRMGICQRFLAGGVELLSLHSAATFDSMRVLCPTFNHAPEEASRPLSARAGGFVPAGGAGFLLLENLASAMDRGAQVYAELVGAFENSGGQRGDGTMTLASSEGAVRCVQSAINDAGLPAAEIDYVNGHLTGTVGDAREIKNLERALGRCSCTMPWINATKSMVGHTLGAAGAIESIATILQLRGGFLHPSKNCEDLLPELQNLGPRIPRTPVQTQVEVALKTSFGFGDVNACLVFRRWRSHLKGSQSP